MNNLKMDDMDIENIIETLDSLQEDVSVPKNVRTKIQDILNNLKEDTSISIKINKALNDMDEIASDVNLQPYTRTQIWNIVSALEKIR